MRPFVTLIFVLLTQKLIVSSFMPCPVDQLCQYKLLTSKSVYSFSKYRLHKFGNIQTNRRTDRLRPLYIRDFDAVWNNGFRHVLIAVGRKVLNRLSFIVTACRYFINYTKDSCCFIDDYFSVIAFRTLAGLPGVAFKMLGIAATRDLHYSTETAKNAVWLSFVNNIRF